MSRAQLWHRLDEVPADLGGTAVTIGNFDGVHRGHQAVLARLQDEAHRRGLRPIALTFNPHPRHVSVRPGWPHLVTGYAERDRLLLVSGVAGVLDLEYTLDFAQHSAEDFVRRFLVDGLGMQCIVMGTDSRFGRGNEGDLGTMKDLGRRLGFDVEVVQEQADDGPARDHESRVSSSGVRAAIESGDVGAAAHMLGRWHTVSDEVHHGHKRGRELGFPTANLGPHPEGLVPQDGVYAGYLTVVAQAPEHLGTPPLTGVPATISIGTNPTFAGSDGSPGVEPPRTVEAYVHTPEFIDLYGDRVRLEFVRRQRPTVRFDSVGALVDQMTEDIRVTRRTLTGATPGSPSPS